MSADRPPILQFFEHSHLPPRLAEVSAPFKVLAEKVAELPRNAESQTALRKLLEAKDAAVRALVAVALLFCLLPSVALAADGGFVSGLLGGLLTAENIGLAVAGILAVGGGFLVRLVTTAIRRRNLAIAVKYAYAMTDEIARLDPATNAIDKVAVGLRELDKWLVAQGWRPANEAEQQVAKLAFTAISGEQHTQAKIAARAAQAAQLGGAAAVPSVPLAS